MNEEKELISLTERLKYAKNITILTGAGISAESGIPTFRGEEGLWKHYRAEQLATPGSFKQNPQLIWEWYDWRRGIIGQKDQNSGHNVLASWEKHFSSFHIITQNIDGLHEKAGSKNVLEFHGNIWKMRCYVRHWNIGRCSTGGFIAYESTRNRSNDCRNQS